MGLRLSCLKPMCLRHNNMKKVPERKQWQQSPTHKDDKKECVSNKGRLTLQDYILSSPRSSQLHGTSSKRVHPNPLFIDDRASKERRALGGRLDAGLEDAGGGGGDKDLIKKTEENLLSKGERTKKKVSFRMPEIADVFILAGSPTTAQESTVLQVDHHHH